MDRGPGVSAILLAAWVFAALNTAFHLGARNFDWGFWLNLALALAIPVVGIVTSREAKP